MYEYCIRTQNRFSHTKKVFIHNNESKGAPKKKNYTTSILNPRLSPNLTIQPYDQAAQEVQNLHGSTQS